MKIGRFVSLLVPLLVAATLLPASADVRDFLQDHGYVRLPVIRPGHDALLVKAEINGHDFTLLVDSGASEVILTRESARNAGLVTHASSIPSVGTNGPLSTSLAEVSSFSIGGTNLELGNVVVSDLRLGAPGGMHFDGLLGLSTMRKNHMVFGYDPAFLYLRPAGVLAPPLGGFLAGAGFTEVPLNVNRRLYKVPVTLDGHTASAILDSGADFTLLDENFAAQKSLNILPPTQGGFSYYAADIEGKKIGVNLVQTATFQIGSFAVPAVKVAVGQATMFAPPEGDEGSKVDMLLGFDMVKHFYAVIDMGGDRLYLRPDRRLFRHY